MIDYYLFCDKNRRDMDKYKLFWLICGLLLLLAEVLVPGFILFFFGVAALVVLLLLILIPGLTQVFWLQLLLWISLSVVLVYFLRSRFAGTFQGRMFRSELDDFVGKTAEVLADISPTEPGRIKYRGTTWKAISEEEEIPEGATVLLLRKSEEESMTFIVKKST